MDSILIVSNNSNLSKITEDFLNKKGYTAHKLTDGKKALKFLKQNDVELVLVSCELSDYSGIEMLLEIKRLSQYTEVILIAKNGTIEEAMRACWKDARDYIIYPIVPEKLLGSIESALSERKKMREIKQKSDVFVLGESGSFRELYDEIKLVAGTDMTVIITGETGTGKEFVARQIHLNSKRKDKSFVAIDCGAISNELAGSEFFGHVKGAFTGAYIDKQGNFELANGGTLFLDEIGNLSVENQTKLLRVFQEKMIRKVGSTKEIKIDVRIISATNEQLESKVKDGAFREDIFYRLNEFELLIKPLRDRPEDIVVYAKHFLTTANRELSKSIIGFSDELTNRLVAYNWPGNLRQLKNVIKRMVLRCDEEYLDSSFFPTEITMNDKLLDDGQLRLNLTNGLPIEGLSALVEEVERLTIEQTLIKHNYNKSKTARILDINRKTLYNKMEIYRINGTKN